MSLSNKILASIIAIVLIITGGFVIYFEFQKNKQLADIQSSIVAQQHLIDGITRSQSQLASKSDLDAFGKAQGINIAAIQDNLNSLNGSIEGINAITIVSSGQQANNLPSSDAVRDPTAPVPPQGTDPFGYLTNEQNLNIDETFSNIKIPIGTVGFSAWKANGWQLNILQRQYKIDTVLGVDENGKHIIYNKASIVEGDKTFDLPVSQASFLEQYPAAKFSWFNPRMMLGLNGSIDISENPVRAKMTPNVGVAISSYGSSLSQPLLSILKVGIGAGFSEGKPVSPELILTPIEFNLGKPGLGAPMMSNTFIGPNISVNQKGELSPGVGVSVSF